MSEVRGGGSVHLLLALTLVIAACQNNAARTQSTPSPAPAEDRRVAAADSKLFAGDYDGAEAAYRSLSKDGVPGAASHLSTLLAYQNRFQEAVSTAQAAVTANADSESLARLTRALDWAQDVNAAIAAGARAVRTKPVDPLAPVFYSEALADSGRFAEAAAQLRTAEERGGDAYVQGEIYREWANYHRARQDTQSELNYTELAVKAQRSFPERQLDLIRYDYAPTHSRVPAARDLTDQLMVAHPKNYWLLVTVADAALVGGDTQRAPALYLAAAEIRPDSDEAVLGLAEIDVALQRDFNSAHDRLLNALKRNPTSSGIYEYLRYLDLLVLKKDPASELDAISPQRPGLRATDRKTALDRVNGLRSTLGVPAITENAALAEAAQAHSYFYLFNAGQQQLNGLGIHTEDAALPGFVGANASDRDRHFGYAGARSSEVITHAQTVSSSIADWTDSVFHRYPLIDRETVAMGYGAARVGALTISVMDLGADQPGAGTEVVYPSMDQTDVPAAFIDNEIPDPLPQGARSPAGYPITLQVGGAQKLAINSGRLLGPDGQEVTSYPLGPGGNQFSNSEWALVPHDPLRPGLRYTAEVAGTVDGKDFSKRWSFTVIGP
jgi:tetratricopeptide (TPR) repeat protein